MTGWDDALAAADQILGPRLADDVLEERARLSTMRAFTPWAFPIIEPKRKFVPGWHIDCICDHLDAVLKGEIRHLLVTIPPRHLKSTLIAVLGPAFFWTRRPELKLMTGSYAEKLALRDARKTRQIITDPRFRRLWPEVRLKPDQNEKRQYELTEGGGRWCFSTGGTVTGEGGDIVLWDDPHKAADMHSPGALEKADEFRCETLPTRVNDPENATFITIMQRLGPGDIAGKIIEEADPDLVHVNLPAHFDPERVCATRWFRDPRKEEGQLLWPAVMSEKAIARITRTLTDTAIAAQLEQKPFAKGGTIFQRSRWRIWSRPKLPECVYLIVALDPAMKDGDDTSYWACQVWGVFLHELPPVDLAPPKKEPNLILLHAWRRRGNYPEMKVRFRDTIRAYTYDDTPPDFVLVENKAAGPILIQELVDAGVHGVTPDDPVRQWGKSSGGKSQAKVYRANMAADIHKAGKVWVAGRRNMDGSRSDEHVPAWAEEVINDCELFPSSGHPDDHVDCCSMVWLFVRRMGEITLPGDRLEQDPVVYEEPQAAFYG